MDDALGPLLSFHLDISIRDLKLIMENCIGMPKKEKIDVHSCVGDEWAFS